MYVEDDNCKLSKLASYEDVLISPGDIITPQVSSYRKSLYT
jgi:hypothetical protein